MYIYKHQLTIKIKNHKFLNKRTFLKSIIVFLGLITKNVYFCFDVEFDLSGFISD